MVAAAVVFPPGQRAIRGLRDSKELSEKQRERLGRLIRGAAVSWAVAAASVKEIDRLNIRRATALAFRRALARLSPPVDYILLDGMAVPELGCEHEAVVDGDAKIYSIAAASVLAKLVRDRLMGRLARHYPSFRWDANKGYGTAEHLAALQAGGPTPHHRRSFTPVVQLRVL